MKAGGWLVLLYFAAMLAWLYADYRRWCRQRTDLDLVSLARSLGIYRDTNPAAHDYIENR